MFTFKRILCPTDFSEASDSALRYAVALARTYGANLAVCHCVTDSPPVGNATRDKIEARVQATIREWGGIGKCPPSDCESIVIYGNPGEEIIRAATEWHADLIVMRSRRRPAAAALLGSTAEAVCRLAPCPVLITHPDEREWVGLTTCEIDLQKILVASDFSFDSGLAMQLALSFAQEYQAELHLLHVLPFTLTQSTLDLPPEMEADFQRAARQLGQSIPEETHLWCKVLQAIKAGQPHREILGYAEANEIDLICMGAQGAGSFRRVFFGSNTVRVTRQAPCPVLIARQLKPAAA